MTLPACYRVYWSVFCCFGAVLAAICGGAADDAFIIAPHLNNVTRNGATLIWETSLELPSIVEYGPENAFNQKAGSDDAVSIHRVRIEGLAPGGHYSYRVHAAESVAEGSFTTAPERSDPVTFIVLGGTARWGDLWESTGMAQHAAQWNPDLYVTTGGLVTDQKDHTEWVEHFQRFASVNGDKWMVPLRGGSAVGVSKAWATNWLHRLHELPDDGKPFYGFQWGEYLFAFFSFEPAVSAGRWLDLHAQASSARHRVVLHPYALYRSGAMGIDGKDVALNATGEAFDRNDVLLSVAGGMGIYERSYPLRANGRDIRRGTTYMVNGGGADSGYPEWFTACRKESESAGPPAYTVVHTESDRVWLRTFAWNSVAETVEELDYAVFWHNPRVPEAELKRLREARGDARLDPVECLGAMAYAPASAELIALLAEEDAALRVAAARALRRIGAAENTQALLPFLQDAEPRVVREIAQALETAMAPDAVKPVYEAVLDEGMDTAARVALLGALQLHAPTWLAVDTAAVLLRNPSGPPSLRVRAGYALARVFTLEDRELLYDLFRVRNEPAVLKHLVAGLNRLSGADLSTAEDGPVLTSRTGEARDVFVAAWDAALDDKLFQAERQQKRKWLDEELKAREKARREALGLVPLD